MCPPDGAYYSRGLDQLISIPHDIPWNLLLREVITESLRLVQRRTEGFLEKFKLRLMRKKMLDERKEIPSESRE